MKKLGFGFMRLPLLDPNDKTSIDFERSKEMVDLLMENGCNYFDTAWMYHRFESERAVKVTLTDRYPRDSFILADKLHFAFFNSIEERDATIYEQLRKTGVEYFDYYMLHGIEADSYKKYEQFDCFNWVVEKKRQGLAKHLGFSYHGNAELLDEILTKYPELEMVQLQLNYLDWESEWIRSREVYEVARKHGKDIVVMEPVKGGTLAQVPEEAERLLKEADPNRSAASWAIRFAASLDGVMVVLSGMRNLEDVKDNLNTISDFKPLTESEVSLLAKVAEIINSQTAVACTGCSYCTEGCPQKIPIPQYFSLYNEDMRENLATKEWSISFTNYEMLANTTSKASDCIECGQCEEVCPQHLPIIEKLKELGTYYESFSPI